MFLYLALLFFIKLRNNVTKPLSAVKSKVINTIISPNGATNANANDATVALPPVTETKAEIIS